MDITFASFLTPTGLIVAAGLITTLIELIRAAFPVVLERASGAALAFVFSALLYIVTAVALRPATADAGLVIFAAWLTCAAAAIGIKSTAKHATSG